MHASELPEADVSGLPRRRPRWFCHVVALLFVVLTFYFFAAAEDLADRLDVGAGYPADVLTMATRLLPGVLLLPFYRRVSYRRRDVLFFLLFPLWGPIVAWKVGYRLTALPFRDWRPRPDEYDRCRRVPGTAWHVVTPA